MLLLLIEQLDQLVHVKVIHLLLQLRVASRLRRLPTDKQFTETRGVLLGELPGLRESLIVELQLPEDFLVLKARRVQHLGREELLKPFQLPLVCDDPRKLLGLLGFLGHVVPEPTIYLR